MRTPQQIDGDIRTADAAARVVRTMLLCYPVEMQNLDIREKQVRGSWRTVVTVTLRTTGEQSADDILHARLGDSVYEMTGEPYRASAYRDGPLRIRIEV